MKILIISQVFWPDETAGSQILTDLAEALAASGLEVDVITSRTAYENENTLFAREETYKGIHIKRLRTSFFGKSSKLGRIINFLLFNTVLFVSLLFKRKGSYDLVLSLSAHAGPGLSRAVPSRLRRSESPVLRSQRGAWRAAAWGDLPARDRSTAPHYVGRALRLQRALRHAAHAQRGAAHCCGRARSRSVRMEGLGGMASAGPYGGRCAEAA